MDLSAKYFTALYASTLLYLTDRLAADIDPLVLVELRMMRSFFRDTAAQAAQLAASMRAAYSDLGLSSAKQQRPGSLSRIPSMALAALKWCSAALGQVALYSDAMFARVMTAARYCYCRLSDAKIGP